ncbi:MAG: DNA-binding response regulator, partial [Streptococcus salivarius]
MAQILVVDDQEDIVQFVVKALELQNHKVTGLTSVLDLDKNSLPRFD